MWFIKEKSSFRDWSNTVTAHTDRCYTGQRSNWGVAIFTKPTPSPPDDDDDADADDDGRGGVKCKSCTFMFHCCSSTVEHRDKLVLLI